MTAPHEVADLVGERDLAGAEGAAEGDPGQRGAARLQHGAVVRHPAVAARHRRRHQDGHVGAPQHTLGRLERLLRGDPPLQHLHRPQSQQLSLLNQIKTKM